MSQDFCVRSVETLVHGSICCSSTVTRFVLQFYWDTGTLKQWLLYWCHKICTANLLRLWYIEAANAFPKSQDASNLLTHWYTEASLAILMSQELYCKFVEALMHWRICCSSNMSQDSYCKAVEALVHWSISCFPNVTCFVLQICWDSNAPRYLLHFSC